MKPELVVGDRSIGSGSPCFIVAEAGVNHNGDVRRAHELIDAASDDQATALEGIFRGNEGGPFGEFAGLISTVAGVERGRITLSGGDSPSGSIEGKTEFSFEPFKGPDGSPTTVSNAMFGFAPTYKVGKGSGRSEAFGLSFEARYGESAEFEFSTEMAGDIHPRA